MVVLRLARAGTKKRPFYWMVATDSRSPRDGRFIEKVGTYDPRAQKGSINLKMDRIQHWLGVGAQTSGTAGDLIRKFKKLLPKAVVA